MRPPLSGLRSSNRPAGASSNKRARIDYESRRRTRMRALLPRYLTLATFAILAFAGARTAIFGAPRPKIERYFQAGSIDIGLESFAQDYAHIYLSWNPRNLMARERALTRFNPSLADEPGFQPSHTVETVTSTQVVQDEPSALGGRIVTVEATVAPGSRTEYLAVSVSRDKSGALSVNAPPSFVGAPSVQENPHAQLLHGVEDQELTTVVERALTNYLAGDANDLTADLAPGTQVTYPPNQLQVVNTPSEVYWTGHDGVLVSVQAQDQQGASYTLSYEIGVVKTERWYVNSIEVIPSQ
jgi:conjugative transposon protein TcpC